MAHSLFFIILTIYLSSLGSVFQTSHSLEESAFVQLTGSMDRDNTDPFILAAGDTFNSESDMDSVGGSGHISDDGTTLKLINSTSNENSSGSGISLTTTPALSLHRLGNHDPRDNKANASITGDAHSSVNMISEEALMGDSFSATEKQITQTQSTKVIEDLEDSASPQRPVQNHMVTSLTKQNLSGPGVSCVLSPCVVFTNISGTNLLWDDMRRTLTFAWELHVFGSASLFILLAGMAVIGAAGACTCPRSFCDSLVLANVLLILSGTLRGVLLLIDPYGTRQVLSRATLGALHNVPLQLLLWAQVALALVTLRGLNLMLLPPKLQRPWVVGVLAITICTSLLLADLFSQTLSPAVPLLLQTLSLCWGLPFCIVFLIKSFSHLSPVLGSSVPQWVSTQRVERRAKRVTAVCAFLGVLCCSLQMYSLLWLYGLLGNWRRFGWGWWLSQFWARILEISWGFSLLLLGSWIFWTPSIAQSKGDPGQSRSEMFKKMEEKSLWDTLLARIKKGPLRKSEKTWEDLIPSNWAKYNLTRTGFSSNPMCPYDDSPTTITPEYKSKPVCCFSPSDSQAALLWQKKVSERDCILSVIQFDIRPPSPITLRHSADNAAHHGQLVAGGLFTAPPPSWTQTVGRDISGRDSGAPSSRKSYISYRLTMDRELKEPKQSPCAGIYYKSCVGGGLATVNRREEYNSAGMYPLDWSDDDVTDL